MPYKSDKIKLPRALDRRVKLTEAQKDEIRASYPEKSLRVLAKIYHVDKRMIQFVLDPAKLEQCKLMRKLRGGSKVYYDKEKNTTSIREHRRYKYQLAQKGLLPTLGWIQFPPSVGYSSHPSI